LKKLTHIHCNQKSPKSLSQGKLWKVQARYHLIQASYATSRDQVKFSICHLCAKVILQVTLIQSNPKIRVILVQSNQSNPSLVILPKPTSNPSSKSS
jgi:hypothetical protein